MGEWGKLAIFFTYVVLKIRENEQYNEITYPILS